MTTSFSSLQNNTTPRPEGPPGAETKSKGRIAFIDGMRALAALYVAAAHAFEIFGLGSTDFLETSVYNDGIITSPGWVTLLYNTLFRYGHYGVAVFIVLSGYSLMLPVAKSENGTLPKGIIQFFKRRIRRIIPPYYAALALSLLLIAVVPGFNTKHGVYWDLALPALEPGPIISHLLLFNNWVPDYYLSINPPLWSIPLEEQIYFLFPFLLLPVWKRGGSLTVIGLAFFIGLAPHFIFNGAYSYSFPWFLGLFSLGMFSACLGFSRRPLESRLREQVPWKWVAWLFLAAFITFSVLDRLVLNLDLDDTMWIKDTLVGLTTASFATYYTLVINGKARPARFSFLRILSAKKLVNIGFFSYSLYLLHAPILALLALGCISLDLPPTLSYLIVFLIGLPLAIFLTYIFHITWERRFMSRPDAVPQTGAERKGLSKIKVEGKP